MFPLSVHNVIPFLQGYSNSVRCHSTVANVFASIKTWSKIKGFSVTELLVYHVNLLLSGLKRSMCTKVNQMLPVTPDLLRRIFQCVDLSDQFHVCMWAAMLFLFYTFFRKSNVLPLSELSFDNTKQVSRNSVKCYNDHFVVSVTWSKTIQYGQKVLLIPVSSVPGSVLCPLRAYIRLVKMVPASPHMPAFCYVNNAGQLVPLTYTAFVSQFRKWLKQLGITNAHRYCTHSFRRGGTTFAFKCNVDPMLIKSQGDWSSDCYRQYIKLDVQDRLVTTRLMSNNIRRS